MKNFLFFKLVFVVLSLIDNVTSTITYKTTNSKNKWNKGSIFPPLNPALIASWDQNSDAKRKIYKPLIIRLYAILFLSV